MNFLVKKLLCLSTLLAMSCLSLTSVRAEITMRTTGVDLHQTYWGGSHRIFVNILNEAKVSPSDLNDRSFNLTIDSKSHPIVSFNRRYQLMPQKTALIIGTETEIDPNSMQVFKEAFQVFIESKNTEDELLIQFNGSDLESQFLTENEDLQQRLNDLTIVPEKTQPFEKFLLGEIRRMEATDKRQWVVLLIPETQTFEEFDESIGQKLIEEFSQRQVSLMVIKMDSTNNHSWLKKLIHGTNGQYFSNDGLDELESQFENIATIIGQEYVLSYHLPVVGTIPHHLELTVQSNQTSQIIEHLIQPPSILIKPTELGNLGLSVLILLGTLMGLGYFLNNRPKYLPNIDVGFQILTPGEENKFLPLEEKYYTLDFLSNIETKGNLRLSANLGKVVLNPHQNSYFLEDKNYKNALLINRRRVRRTLLQDGDILDIGEMTLIYRNRKGPSMEEAQAEDKPIPIHFDKPRGPVRKGSYSLVDENTKLEYHLVKNITFIGSSETGDLVLKGGNISARHAKLVRIGGQYKVQDLGSIEGTYVNNRRVEQRFLRDGDTISFDTVKLKFRIGKN